MKKVIGYQSGPRMFNNWEEAAIYAERNDFPMPETIYETVEEATEEGGDFPAHQAWVNGNIDEMVEEVANGFTSPTLSENRKNELAAAKVWSMWSEENQKLEAMVSARDYTYATLYDRCYASDLTPIGRILEDLTGSRTITSDVQDKTWENWS